MAEDIKNIHLLLLQLTSSVAEVKEAINNLQQSQDCLGARVTEVECRVSRIKDAEQEELQRRQQMEQRLTVAVEGVEGGNPMQFLQSVLPDLLGLDKERHLEIERAHRALGPRPAPDQRPKAFIIKLLRFPTRELLLRTARLKGQLVWRESRISLCPDWSRDLQIKRQRFTEARRMLQDHNIKFGLFYPAILKITVNGETRSFTEPEEVKKFLSEPETSSSRELIDGLV
uniref:L1 transposable element RRM domain-containing protein n=1 Tax=Latimeria chalumnae TaxID=7897 RepID=H3A1B4_LATCH